MVYQSDGSWHSFMALHILVIGMDAWWTTAVKVFRAIMIPLAITLVLIAVFILLLVSILTSEASLGTGALLLLLIMIGVPTLVSILLGMSLYIGRDMARNRGGSMKEVLYAGLAFAFIPCLLFVLPTILAIIRKPSLVYSMGFLGFLVVAISLVFFALMVGFTVAGGYAARKPGHSWVLAVLIIVTMLPVILLLIHILIGLV